MKAMLKNIYIKIFRNQYNKGATAIEYALIVALVAVVCIAAFNMLGTAIKDKIQSVTNSISPNNASSGGNANNAPTTGGTSGNVTT